MEAMMQPEVALSEIILPPETVVVEVLDQHGRVCQRERILVTPDRRRFTAGRSAAADVMLDDIYAAAIHAAFEVTADGRILVDDLDSINGIVVDEKRSHGVKGLALTAGTLQLGRTTLRLRLAAEVLAPEKPDHAGRSGRSIGRIAVAAIAACILFVIYFAWLGAPRDLATTAAAALTTSLSAAAGWIAIWALLSRVIQGEWRVEIHAAIFFCVAAGLLLFDSLRDIVWFSLALPSGVMFDLLLGMAAVALALYLHLTYASNMKARSAALGAILLPLLIGGSGAWVQTRNQARDVNHIGVREQIYPPALRLRAASSLDSYFDGASELKTAAEKKRRAMPSDEADEDE